MDYSAKYLKVKYPFYVQLYKPRTRFVFFLCTVLLSGVKPVNAKHNPGAWLLFWTLMFLVLISAFLLDLVTMLTGGLFYLLYLKTVNLLKWSGKKLDHAANKTIDVVFDRIIKPIAFSATLLLIAVTLLAVFKTGFIKQVYNYIVTLF